MVSSHQQGSLAVAAVEHFIPLFGPSLAQVSHLSLVSLVSSSQANQTKRLTKRRSVLSCTVNLPHTQTHIPVQATQCLRESHPKCQA